MRFGMCRLQDQCTGKRAAAVFKKHTATIFQGPLLPLEEYTKPE